MIETLRGTNGDDGLSETRTEIRGKRERRKAFFFDLDHGQINVAVRADEPGLINALPVPEVGVIGHQLKRGRGKDDANARCA